MPSETEHRIYVTFSKHLEVLEMVKRDAELEERSESSVVVRALVSYYQQRKMEAELFKNGGLAEKPAPVFVTPSPDQLAAGRVAKIREMHGPEKS